MRLDFGPALLGDDAFGGAFFEAIPVVFFWLEAKTKDSKINRDRINIKPVLRAD